MPRTQRRSSSTGIHHVIARGLDGMDVFCDDQDRLVFLRHVKTRLEKAGGRLYAWCLMDDHVHLLFHLGEGCVPSRFMQALGTGYASYFNSRHGRSGHFFWGRFKSEPVEDGPYFRTVVRFIHQNPVKALVTPDCRYRWSSFCEYAGRPVFSETSRALGVFGGLESFLSFHRELAWGDGCLEVPVDLPDGEAARYARELVGEDRMRALRDLEKAERDEVFRLLRSCMLPVAQIARITEYGKSTIYAA